MQLFRESQSNSAHLFHIKVNRNFKEKLRSSGHTIVPASEGLKLIHWDMRLVFVSALSTREQPEC